MDKKNILDAKIKVFNHSWFNKSLEILYRSYGIWKRTI